MCSLERIQSMFGGLSLPNPFSGDQGSPGGASTFSLGESFGAGAQRVTGRPVTGEAYVIGLDEPAPPTTMESYAGLLGQLKKHEGFRAKPYRDTVGKLTVGFGRNLDDVGIEPHEAEALGIDTSDLNNLNLTKEQAEGLLRNDVMKVSRRLSREPWFRKLDPTRQNVMVNMAFNMGVEGLRGFKKMRAALEQGDYSTAADEMLDSKWSSQVGRRARELAEQMRQDG